MTMQFGIFDHVERRDDVDLAQQLEERLQLVARAEEVGFSVYHVAEHHNSPLNLAPNGTAYLAAVAQRTKRIRLTTLVSVLPLHHPVRLIEDVCLIDHLSNGRFEVGVGRGTDRAQELRMWGGDAAENDERFEESLGILIAGLQTDFLSFQGRFYRFNDLWMELRPLQRPLPPFWWPGNPLHAGERRMNFVGGSGSVAEIRAAVDQFRAVYAASTAPDLCGREAPLYGGRRHLYIAETDGEAEERARQAYAAYRRHFYKPLPGGRVDPAEIPRPALVDPEVALTSGQFLYGSPATVRGAVQAYVADSGANYLVFSPHWGDLTHAEAMRSLELLGAEVLPAVAARRIGAG
jgi:alkanesulfonate monooxygenase SsuD/methylene tetrahydromethanopterin reductase-like flavin-dependent oxidoreductase (luciferase family)